MDRERAAYTRADLTELAALGRTEVLGVLGSFDDTGMDDAAFALRAARLLDGGCISGLEAAAAACDADGVLAAVQAWADGLDADGNGLAAAGPGGLAPETAQREAIIAAADAVRHHRFTFYSETLELPDEIDWDVPPGTAHWGHDLNRFSFLRPLVQAFEITGEVRYARKGLSLILDWIRKNPVERCFRATPYAYGSYLNQAIHCPAWANCVRALLRHGQVTPMELLRVVVSLQEQLAYLEIVTAGHAGNWPTIGCQGILGTLSALPLLGETERLARYSTRSLAEQVDEQVLPDGVQDELTPHYHRCVINNILSAAASARVLGYGLEPRTLRILGQMIHYQQQMTVPDRSAEVAFNDSDPASVGHLERSLKELGLEALATPDEELGPESFPYAGVALLRQKPLRGDLYLAFDGGPFGRSHQHEDKLGFWLFAYGRNLLVDPGRHLYDSSAASYLAHLRSTRAHSTVCVDGEGQNSRARPDSWIAAEPVPLAFSATADEVRASACYDLGYGPDNTIGVVHRREIVFVRERFWVLFDRIEGVGIHRVESRFQFAPGQVRIEGVRATTRYDDANLLLQATGAWEDVHIECGQEDPRGGWYSPSYSLIEPAPALSLATDAELPLSYAVLLWPYRGVPVPDIRFAFDGQQATVAGAGMDAVVETRLAL